VLLVTDGVHHDQDVDLDRPLSPSEGRRLADDVPVPRVPAERTTVLGIAQVDADHPVPGVTWPREIRAFNARLCERSGADECRLYTTASVSDALD
jgi:hypothetical protein